MNPVVEAHHDELYEGGIRHNMPAPRMVMPQQGMPAPPPQYVAAGQLQAPEFPDFRTLNMGGPAPGTLREAAAATRGQGWTYDRARDTAVG